MITKHDLENLTRYEARTESPILSVYLHRERSNGVNAAHAMLTELRRASAMTSMPMPNMF
jgi:hypothetical protein